MADVTWTKTTSGTVQDTQGNNVGTADGAGNILITANVEVGPATEILTITEGVTVKFDTGYKINVRCTPASGTYGTFRTIGTVSEPVILTSSAGSPAAGDWNGIAHVGANVSYPTVAPRVELTMTTVEYVTNCIASQSGASYVPNYARATQCTFRHWSTTAIAHQAGQGAQFPWLISYCQFVVCPTEGLTAILCSSGGLPTTASQYAQVLVDHASFLLDTDSNSQDAFAYNIGNRSTGYIKNSVIVVKNPGTQGGNIVTIGPTASTFTNNNNFYWTPDADASEEYTPDATDQNVDPSYADDTCTSANLSPDAQAGSPDLYIADSGGSYCGAVQPYNYPGGVSPDPVGTTGVWAGYKQRVYEVSFGSDANKTLGRAIRVEVSSSDLFGVKLIGGMYLKVNPERLK